MMIDRAPPVRLMAVITLCAITLDLLADIILCIRFGQYRPSFNTQTAKDAVIGYYFFTGVSCLTFLIELTDVILTLKNNQENRILSRLSKSIALVFEEVPLPVCLLIIYANERHTALANPAMLASCIKLVALVWGIVKFAKLQFCWFFLPITNDHGTKENIRRCFTFKWWRICMLLVNICHVVAIVLTIINIICAADSRQFRN